MYNIFEIFDSGCVRDCDRSSGLHPSQLEGGLIDTQEMIVTHPALFLKAKK
jgi:hypothetical protein